MNLKMNIMKTVNSFAIALVLFLGTSYGYVVNAQQEEEQIKSMAEFDKTTYDFGNIVQGVPVKAIFKVKNTSLVPLTITNVKPSCGCTVADYPKDPILPGETGEIVATYNAKGIGPFTKTVTVYSNSSEPTIVLHLKGTQVKADEEQPQK